ncbi:hypothetical protein [Streptomyces aidingensis]|uniref:Uncharacterized protein n=1 Tax=Streptomyces aidingensis TaxID=910347 RepID=A0A1I1HTU1_9ACTN|nr:hypothetical protein [Streptomyces aidingensis]SFC27559.1 hypothetical protein SAMN05421773_102526 [Streptomyces aidingensis]
MADRIHDLAPGVRRDGFLTAPYRWYAVRTVRPGDDPGPADPHSLRWPPGDRPLRYWDGPHPAAEWHAALSDDPVLWHELQEVPAPQPEEEPWETVLPALGHEARRWESAARRFREDEEWERYLLQSARRRLRARVPFLGRLLVRLAARRYRQGVLESREHYLPVRREIERRLRQAAAARAAWQRERSREVERIRLSRAAAQRAAWQYAVLPRPRQRAVLVFRTDTPGEAPLPAGAGAGGHPLTARQVVNDLLALFEERRRWRAVPEVLIDPAAVAQVLRDCRADGGPDASPAWPAEWDEDQRFAHWWRTSVSVQWRVEPRGRGYGPRLVPPHRLLRRARQGGAGSARGTTGART